MIFLKNNNIFVSRSIKLVNMFLPDIGMNRREHKIELNTTKSYSKLSAYTGLIFSIYGLIMLYINSYIIWIPLGLCLLICLLSIVNGIDFVIDLFPKYLLPRKVERFLLYLVSFGYMTTTTYGLFNLANQIPIRDKSILLFPFIILLIIFTGAAIGITDE